MSPMHTIDKLDKASLRRLQANGRETYDVIGEQVGLSPSAVLRRVKRLEEMVSSTAMWLWCSPRLWAWG